MKNDVAIVGMTCKFSGANNVSEFWDLCRSGSDGIKAVANLIPSEYEAAKKAGLSYIHRRGQITNACNFDAKRFGYTEQEALLLDPQFRHMLESVSHLMASRTSNVEEPNPKIGVFASLSPTSYRQFVERSSYSSAPFASDYCLEDLVPLRISHKLNLTGISVRVQSTCSSSLLAVHMAMNALNAHECDEVIIVAASISFPEARGYEVFQGGVRSASGKCTPFDKTADGIVPADGVAAIRLKRLVDAERDMDLIHGTIIGSACNNDGSDKMSLAAPSYSGQLSVIRDALASAQISPDKVAMVEAHGTGTFLGDPIEFEALRDSYRSEGTQSNICLTAGKSNIGHTDVVAGLAGLIRATLACQHRTLLPIHGFTSPHPDLQLADSPFHVLSASKIMEGDGPMITGVSALGMGGTNVHMLVRQYTNKSQPELSLFEGYDGKRFSLEDLYSNAEQVVTEGQQVIGRTTPEADVLQSVLEEFFGKEVHDDGASFYSLGGDSILALQLAHAIHQKLGIKLPVDMLLDDISISSLKEYITDEMGK